MRTLLSLLVVLLLSTAVVLFAEPPGDHTPNPPGLLTPDWQTFFDANDILMFVSNTGIFAYDDDQLVHSWDGFYYPFTGDTATTGDSSLIYSAGLWLGGTINSETRVAVAEYDHDYVPGPMENGTYLPDSPEFRVYKIDESSGPGDPDWDNWPEDQGAPTDGSGDPMLLGDQTLWSVFNDADPNQHQEYNTDPLGIEVQHTVWGSDNPLEKNVLYMKYKMYNEGGNTITDFYVGVWFDLDLGFSMDDLTGCDTLNDFFFARNDGDDDDFGTNPPAMGGVVVSGPVVPAPGETADFDGNPLSDHKNVGMTGFNCYINGEDPHTAEAVYNYLRSLNDDGTPILDPATNNVLKYEYPGDPLTGTGWVDMSPSDKRMMCLFGPFTFAPGDSQQVVLKLGATLKNDGEPYGGEVERLKSMLLADFPEVFVEPETMHRNWSWSFEPIPASMLIPDQDGFSASDIDLNSISINDTIDPFNVEVLPSHPDFAGQVLKADFWVKGFLNAYMFFEGPLFDTTTQYFQIAGETFLDEPFIAYGTFNFVGRYSGDANNDGFVDIDDVIFTIEYVFSGGPAPRPLDTVDCNCSGEVDVDDVIYLIEYIFGNGPKPRAGC